MSGAVLGPCHRTCALEGLAQALLSSVLPHATRRGVLSPLCNVCGFCLARLVGVCPPARTPFPEVGP